MIERSVLLDRAADWMAARGWRAKLAKSRHQQSLFEHSLIELDVLLDLLPILSSPAHLGLNDDEATILAVAVLVHDSGKETAAWQLYVQGKGPKVQHILPELTRTVVPELCAALGLRGLDQKVERVVAHCADFHHSRPGRSDAAILEAMLSGGSDRFLVLATLVKGIDHFCSAASADEAESALLSDPALGHHLTTTRHEVVVRGVATAFLHTAARTAHVKRGWRPVLYFLDATLYAADPRETPLVPSAQEIGEALKVELESAIARDVAPLMVGSPVGNILPKPDLVSFAESRSYLESAAQKVGSKSLAKKGLKDKRKVVQEYWRLKGKAEHPSDEDVEREAARISVAQPEMVAFKFFKAMVDPGKIEALDDVALSLARDGYETIFGDGAWTALQSTSTLMPAKDMVKTVDLYWSLPGEAVGHPEVARVAELPDATRVHVLIDLLDSIAQEVYKGRESPRDGLSANMAEAFLGDLLRPAGRGDVQEYAQRQLDHYVQSKPFAGRESPAGTYLCPICNTPFGPQGGITASADFIENPQTHTNRGVALGRFGYIVVCRTCYYERLILQVLMASRPAEVITLLPRLSLGPEKGERFVSQIRAWVEAAKRLMRGDGEDLRSGFSLGFTDQVARRLGDRDPFTLGSGELLSLFSFRFKEDTQKARRREAMKRLREEFNEDREALTRAANQSFSSWDAAVDALIEGRVPQQDFLAIRREVFRLYETIHLICRTPNLVLVPLTYEVASGNDESETNKALRRLYVALVLGLVFDASVAIHRQGELVDFSGRSGTAYVPPVPAVRSRVGEQWVSIREAKRWLSAIGAASQLAGDSGLSRRSALYQILVADPPERIARRIEQNLQGQHRQMTLDHLLLIERVRALGRTQGEVTRP